MPTPQSLVYQGQRYVLAAATTYAATLAPLVQTCLAAIAKHYPAVNRGEKFAQPDDVANARKVLADSLKALQKAEAKRKVTYEVSGALSDMNDELLGIAGTCRRARASRPAARAAAEALMAAVTPLLKLTTRFRGEALDAT